MSPKTKKHGKRPSQYRELRGRGGQTETPGRSGVYPVSEIEQAPGDATIPGQASWGQGTRGAAGYEDHGESGLYAMPGARAEDTSA